MYDYLFVLNSSWIFYISIIIFPLFFFSCWSEVWDEKSRIFPTLETWSLGTFTYINEVKESLVGNPELKDRTENKCYLQLLQLCFHVKDSLGQVVQLHFR